jgi:hypothetical protein
LVGRRAEYRLETDEFFFLLATGSQFVQIIPVEGVDPVVASAYRGLVVFLEVLSKTVFIPSIEPQLIDSRFLRSGTRRTVPVIFAGKGKAANVQNERVPSIRAEDGARRTEDRRKGGDTSTTTTTSTLRTQAEDGNQEYEYEYEQDSSCRRSLVSLVGRGEGGDQGGGCGDAL